jgi:UDP-2-acetamido-2-deoxy-ribo-hexuluronate aminotransferase
MNGRFDSAPSGYHARQMARLSAEVKARDRIGARYTEMLGDVCATPAIREGNTHVYAQYTIRVPDRDALAAKLQALGIPTAVCYPKCLHEQPVFAALGYKYGDFPAAHPPPAKSSASRSILT